MASRTGSVPGSPLTKLRPVRPNTKRPPTLLPTLLSLLLMSCGGGGSSGGSAPPPPAPKPSISFDPTATSFTSDRTAPNFTPNIYLTLKNTTTSGLVLFGHYTHVGIARVDVDLTNSDFVRLMVVLRPPVSLFNGTYSDEITINACLDAACNQPLAGSPLTIPVKLTITGTDPVTGLTGPPPSPNGAPLAVRSRVALTHDIRDAEYSRSLDRIVMVSTRPSNALFVYDPVTDTEKSLPLSNAPTSVSISPDGLRAAIGHDGLISIVNLAQVGQQPAQTPTLLSVSGIVFDLALDGRGRVHFIPDNDVPGTIHSVDIATGVDQPGNFSRQVYGHTYLRLHPSGDFLFLSDPGFSTGVDKWDITGQTAQYVTHGDLEMLYIRACGNLWFNESGTRVYSQCGTAFETVSAGSTWLAPVGKLGLSGPALGTHAFTIDWMDHLAARNEIALVETDDYWCRSPEYSQPCWSELATFDSELLTRRSIYAFPPVTINGLPHVQRGLFVFYRSDGSAKYLLSQLDAMSDPTTEYFLSVVD